VTLRESYQGALAILVASGCEDAEIEAQLICRARFSYDGSGFLLNLKQVLTPQDQRWIKDRAKQRALGIPLGYVLGEWDFMGHRFFVGKGVLIPRPETEGVVLAVSAFVAKLGWADESFTILELGVGSGIISIMLKKQFSQAKVYGWERSQKAARIAQKNAKWHQVDISIFQSDFFSKEALWRKIVSQETRVLLVTNPPYVARREWEGLDAKVRNYEPVGALLGGGGDGASYYRRIGDEFFGKKIPVICEIGKDQGKIVQSIALKKGCRCLIAQDLQGFDRICTVSS